jgi:hypothetical protein
VAKARTKWRENQPELTPGKLVFIDETWTTNMTRLYGRAEAGRRLVAAVPHGHWQTSTFIAGLRHDGMVGAAVMYLPAYSPDRTPSNRRLHSKLTTIESLCTSSPTYVIAFCMTRLLCGEALYRPIRHNRRSLHTVRRVTRVGRV